nr:hypothetical protein [Tanacetum cinerariifolium]
GNAIHCTTKANIAHNFLKLKEGSVYLIRDFVVHPNKDVYRIFRDHAVILEFDGETSMRKTFVKGGGFVRYPFELQDLRNIKLTNNNDGEGALNQVTMNVDHFQPKDGTLENLLIWSSTFNYKVKIDNIRTKKGWNYPSCEGYKFKKGIDRKARSFWCDSCNNLIKYPVLRFRLELDISDQTTSTVVVMFDDTSTELVKCSADSIVQAKYEETTAEMSFIPLVSTCHISYLLFNKVELEDSKEEMASAWSGSQENAKDGSTSEKKKKRRYIVYESDSE